MTADLFGAQTDAGERLAMGEQACVLRGFALACAPDLLNAIKSLERISPFRHMVTPGGLAMSAAMTSCGTLGWVTDRQGYRYTAVDPRTARPWPAMPGAFRSLACAVAQAAGFEGFEPDACLINRYAPGAGMSLHQDRNEHDLTAPIVSVSLGVPAIFLFGGHVRSARPLRVPLLHGDVAVWGGADRMRYHGVMPVAAHSHSLTGAVRINLTFRKAGGPASAVQGARATAGRAR